MINMAAAIIHPTVHALGMRDAPTLVKVKRSLKAGEMQVGGYPGRGGPSLTSLGRSTLSHLLGAAPL